MKKTDPISNGAKKIAIFGGTFDPVHNGHLQIVQSFLHTCIVDELWVMPTPMPPFKTEHSLTPFEHRFNMVQLAFEQTPQVFISNFESQLIGVSYTFNTLSKLKEKYPEYSWYLCIGGDNLMTFTKWHKYKEILEIARLLVASRPGNTYSELEQSILDKTHFVEHTPIDMSSTEVRQALRENNFSFDIPQKVMTYIRTNRLYKK